MLVVAITVYPSDFWDGDRPEPSPLIAGSQAAAAKMAAQYLREAYELDEWLDEETIELLMQATSYEAIKSWLNTYYCALTVTYNEVDL